jgi:glutathione S-transferase
VPPTYERLIRPSAYRWSDWTERCRTQGSGAIAALAAEPWPREARLDQAQITAACMIRYVRMVDLDRLPPGRFPTLDALSARCEARPEFQATYPTDYAVPRSE